jgi:hypothetical protein
MFVLLIKILLMPHSLIATAVKPSTNLFCTRENRIMVGTLVRPAAAANWPHLMSRADAKIFGSPA